MKRILCIFLGSIFLFIMGTLISIPIHNWYTSHYFIIQGYDDENKFMKFVVLVEWPLFILGGGLIGNLFCKKYFVKAK